VEAVERTSSAPAAGVTARRGVWIRLVASSLLLLLVLGVLWLHDHLGDALPSDLLLLVLGAAAAYELVLLVRESGHGVGAFVPVVATALLGGIGLLAGETYGERMEMRVVLLAGALLAVLATHARDLRPEAVVRIALELAPVLYVGLMLSFVRESGTGPDGARRLAWMALTAKASDIGGWLVGKPLGRHKLAPRISPKKSWEGLAGGLALSVLVAIFLPVLLHLDSRAWSVSRRALFGVAVGAAAVVAGLAWSAWKRRLGAKDSSRLLPEMGGVLDLVDSLLLAGPVAWLWFRLGL
jgi:phosphatidate cytidylyltransferase